MACLLTIPLETLLQITSYLSTPEYGALRATCRELEKRLSLEFAKEFFVKRQFAMVEFSIKALVDISKSRFAAFLSHVIIHLEYPAGRDLFRPGAGVFATPATGDFHRTVLETRYRLACYARWGFMHSGLALEMLTEAFKNLPNLKTVGIRDFNSQTRWRDGGYWNSYGIPTFRNQTNGPLYLPNDSAVRGYEDIGIVFMTLLRALSASTGPDGGHRVTRLEILLHHCFFLDEAFQIPFHLESQIVPVLSKLKTVILDGLTPVAKPLYVAFDNSPQKVYNGAGYFLSRFLVKLQALEYLRLNFKGYKNEDLKHILEWLGGEYTEVVSDWTPLGLLRWAALTDNDVLPVPFPPAPDFPNLHSLDLGMLTVSEKMLTTLIKRYRATLQRLCFHKIKIDNGTVAKNKSWVNICKAAAESGLLKRFQLSYVGQKCEGRTGNISFTSTDNLRVMVWQGPAYGDVVDFLIERMKVTWTPPLSEDIPNDSDEDLMEDGNDDD